MGTDSSLKVYNQDNNSEFAKLISQNLDSVIIKDNTIVTGTVEKIDDKYVHIYIKGAKSSGIVDINEVPHAELDTLEIGKDLEVFCERTEDKNGNIVLSIEKARRAKSWDKIKEVYEKQQKVSGVIKSAVRGGYQVEIMGLHAFTPNSQMDTRPIKNIKDLMGKPLEFRVIKIDESRMNLIASRRQVIEEENNKGKEAIIKKYSVGDEISCKVKAIQSYGIFCSVEDTLDSLLHSSHVSHMKVNNISDMFEIGEEIRCKVIDIDVPNLRMSLSIKDLIPDPFETLKEKYTVGNDYEVKITKLTEWGAFAELDSSISGLIHTSEIHHGKKNVNPKSVFKVNDVVTVRLKEVDFDKKKIALSYKDCLPNPVDEFEKKYPIGSIIECSVVNKKEFGLFLGTDIEGVDIFVHYKQLDYSESSKILDNFKKDDKLKVKIIDIKDGKVNGSLRAMQVDPFSFFEDKKVGDVISTRVVEVMDNALKVDCGPNRFSSLIRRTELALEKADQRCNRFSPGDTIDAAILELEIEKRRVKLSVKKLEQQEKDAAIEKYGSTDSGASLGAILGEALDKKDKKD